MDFGVAVFTGFRGGHLNNLAGAVLQNYYSSVKKQTFKKFVKPTLIMTNPPLRRAEHCMGKVAEAPASAPPKSYSPSAIFQSSFKSERKVNSEN